jgi:hypothetical protein
LKAEVCTNHLTFVFNDKGDNHQLYFGKKYKAMEFSGVRLPIPLDNEKHLEKVSSESFSFYSMTEVPAKSILSLGEINHPIFLNSVELIQKAIAGPIGTVDCNLYNFVHEYSGAIDTKRDIAVGRLHSIVGGLIYVAGFSKWGGEPAVRYFIHVGDKWYLIDYQIESL